MYYWDIIYQILGVTFIVAVSIAVYKIYIASNADKYGIARSE